MLQQCSRSTSWFRSIYPSSIHIQITIMSRVYMHMYRAGATVFGTQANWLSPTLTTPSTQKNNTLILITEFSLWTSYSESKVYDQYYSFWRSQFCTVKCFHYRMSASIKSLCVYYNNNTDMLKLQNVSKKTLW